MSRKDYDALAAALRAALGVARQTLGPDGRTAVRITAHRVADVLAADNPRFDRQCFLSAALPVRSDEP